MRVDLSEGGLYMVIHLFPIMTTKGPIKNDVGDVLLLVGKNNFYCEWLNLTTGRHIEILGGDHPKFLRRIS